MKKTELQSIIREEIESALGEKNILSEATQYTWDVTQHKLHRYTLGRSGRGTGVSTWRVMDWKKGQTVTVKAGSSFEAAKKALAKVWTAEGNLNIQDGEGRELEAHEYPKGRDVEELTVSIKKR